MPGENEGRLFHTLVLMGIGLTGAVVAPALPGCGGNITTETKASSDAGTDAPYAMIGTVMPDAAYAMIGRVAAFDAGKDASYAVILPALPPDAGDAAYPTIGIIEQDAAP
jgi:hypothetical protein